MRLKKGGNRYGSAQDYVEAAAPAVTAVRGPDRGDPRRMARSRQPVVNRGPNSPALHRRLARARVAGDQQQDPLAGSDRPLQRPVDRAPRRVEAVAVKVERAVRARRRPRFSRRSQPPSSVACRSFGLCRRRLRRRGGGARPCGLAVRRRRDRADGDASAASIGLARQRPDGRGHPAPTARLRQRLSDAHAPPRPWAAGSAPGPWPTCRRRSAARLAPAPQKVSKRLAPLIAPPVSCATHRPLASARSSVRNTGAPKRHELRIGGDVSRGGHRHAERAERARPGQLPEEDVARILAHQRAARHRAGRASRRRSPPCWRRRAGGCRARAAAGRSRHIRGRSGRHSRSASPAVGQLAAGPSPGSGGRTARSGRPPRPSSSPRPASAPSSISARV